MNLKIKNLLNIEKNYKIFVILLLLIALSLSIWAAKTDSETTDESVYIASSYQLLKYGDFRFNPEHPPLGKYFTSIPLLFIDINEPSRENLLKEYGDYYRNGFWEIFQYGNNLVYHSGNDAEQIIFLTRLSSIIFMLLLGLLIFKWVKEAVGIKSALFALIVYLFNPLVLAMGHLATLDMVSVFTMILSIYTFYRYVKKPNYKNIIIAAVGLGLAVLSRYSNAYLALFYTGWLIYLVIKNKQFMKYIWHFILLGAISLLILWIGYGAPLEGAPEFNSQSTQVTMGPQDGSSVYNQSLQKYAHIIRPAYYFKGLMLTFDFFSDGHGATAFLDGRTHVGGWWFYFPFAYLYKTPIYLMIFNLIFVYLFFRYYKKNKSLFSIYLVSAMFLFGLFALKSKMNLGVRYILPIYIINFLLIGYMIKMVSKKYLKYIWILLFLTIIYSMIIISPKYLTYFNAFAGGSENGWKHLSDSNLDWGQDVKRLKNYLDENEINKIYIDYMWKKDPLDYYNINYEQFDEQKHTSGYLLISANSIYPNKDLLDNFELLTRLGNATYVYRIK